MHRSKTVFAKLLDHCKDQPQRDAMLEGFGATAYAFREHPNATKPANPYNAENGEKEAALYGCWREGSLTAEQYWHDWAELPTREREVWERGAQDWSRNLGDKLAKQAPPATQPATEAAAETAPGSAAVPGYQPVTDGKLQRVNVTKILEERVLRVIDTLLTEFQNEVGDIAKEQAEFQDMGYKRMSVFSQKEKIAELAGRMAEVQGALRWLALGKTDVEKGFMAINRSIFRPARVGLPEDK